MTYNPSNPMFTGSNKPYGTQGQPDTAKSWYYDSTTGVKRPFNTTLEILEYFDTPIKRKGVTGAVLVDEDGAREYWWPDPNNLTDDDLLLKSGISLEEVETLLFFKVDKEDGKGLSTNDFTDEDKTNLNNQSGINTGDQDLSNLVTTEELNIAIDAVTANIPGPGQGLKYDINNDFTLDLDSTTIVTPVITASWSLYKQDGITPYIPSTSSSKTLVVDKGVKALLDAYYRYPSPVGLQGLPTGVSGSFPTPMPGPNTDSPHLIIGSYSGGTVNPIVANATYNVTLSKPKSGLIVVSNQVAFATGNDTSSDSMSITFRGKGFLFYSTNPALTGADISALIANSTTLALMNGAFQTSVARTYNTVTAGVGFYTYILQDATFADITSIIQNGALPVRDAFGANQIISFVNEAGFTMNGDLIKSNSIQAFTNATLTIS